MTRLLRGQDLSYGIYLWHMLVVYTLMGLGYSRAPILWFAVVAGTAALAALSWFLVERPVLRLKKRSAPVLVGQTSLSPAE